jgi:hypothetical protein
MTAREGGTVTTAEILTLVVAVYAAILSTILGAAQFRREKRRIKVSCRLAVTALPAGESVELVSIEAVNTGHRPIEIRMAGLLMSNGHLFTQVASRLGPTLLPKKLYDGDSVAVFFDLDKAKLAIRDADIPGLRFTRALVRDAEGREYQTDVPEAIHPLPARFSAA